MSAGAASDRSCRLAIAGCGAVSRIYYAPALAALSGQGAIELVGAFDPDQGRAEALARQHAGARAASCFEELLALGPELLIIASPPAAHALQAVAAMESGANVLCEKPFAPTLPEAEAMVAAADRTGRTLVVGHVRRQFPAAVLIRDFLTSGLLGDIRAVTWFEGGPFEWPIADPGYFSRTVSGGGVLQDIGPHVLDLLTSWLGPPASHSSADDAMGGVEANCRVRLDYGTFVAEVRLSRDWHRPNLCRIEGTGGVLEWLPDDAEGFTVHWIGLGNTADVRLGSPDDLAPPFHRYFEHQVLGAIAAGRGAPSSVPRGQEALATVALIDACWSAGRLISMPWLGTGERGRAEGLRGQVSP